MPTILFSVYEKAGLEGIAAKFVEWGWDLLASGGTAKYLKERDFHVQDVADLVGGGPILGHRVVTISRELHAGLLAQDNEADRAELESLGIPFIDAVYVTLYPLAEELRNPAATLESVTEKTDIGGPTMLRSAAKGRRLVASNSQDMASIVEDLAQRNGKPDFDPEQRRDLARRAEWTVATYCLASTAALENVPIMRQGLIQAHNQISKDILEIRCNI